VNEVLEALSNFFLFQNDILNYYKVCVYRFSLFQNDKVKDANTKMKKSKQKKNFFLPFN
jgi:hypothetical protein